MPLARIFRPSKTSMQSGLAKTKSWVLEWEPTVANRPGRLMGWTESSETQTQCQLHFDTSEEAVAYAQAHQIPFQVFAAQERRVIIKAYADNFASNRIEPWTH